MQLSLALDHDLLCIKVFKLFVHAALGMAFKSFKSFQVTIVRFIIKVLMHNSG